MGNHILLHAYSMSWKRRMARPGISELHSLAMTSAACSQGKTECGGGSIFLLATSSTSSASCSAVPFEMAMISCWYCSDRRENLGSSFSATSSLISTTPPFDKQCIERCRLLEVVPKSMTTSTAPPHTSLVRSISCGSYRHSFHWTTLTLEEGGGC